MATCEMAYMILLFFFLYAFGDHRELNILTHSFPTRRSSDVPDCSSKPRRARFRTQVRGLRLDLSQPLDPHLAEHRTPDARLVLVGMLRVAKFLHHLEAALEGDVEAARNLPHVEDILSSEERRVGKEWVSTCRSRWSPND